MRRSLVMSVAIVLLSLFLQISNAGAQPIGFRLLVQPWNPVTDDDSVVTPIDDPTLISGKIAEVWATLKPRLHDVVLAELGKPDLLGEGVTLYDIRVGLTEPVLSLERLSGGGVQGPLVVRAILTAPRAAIAATSTTPTILPEWFDPRCSAVADLAVAVELVVGTDVAQPLQANPDGPGVTLSVRNFSWDSENFPCDVVKEVVGLLGAEERIKRAVERPQNTQALAAMMSSALNSALTAANAQIAQAVPAGLLSLSGWVNQTRGGGQLVALYVGVTPPLPDPSPRATIAGTIRMADGQPTTRIRCDRLPLLADRTTGPRRVINDRGGLADETPRERLGISISCGELGADGSRSYVLSGLSSGFRNYFTQTGLRDIGCNEDGELLDTSTWPADEGVPATLAAPHDITIRTISGFCFDKFFPPEQDTSIRPDEIGPGVIDRREITNPVDIVIDVPVFQFGQ